MNRICNKCHINKPLSDFYEDKRRKEGRQYECKQCCIARVKATRDPERARDNHYRRTYGISLADFNRMVLEQGNKCACCDSDKPGGKHNQWCVDHDHITGAVRQLLCKDCNIVLGLVEDSPEHLQRLIDYIIRHTDELHSRTTKRN